MIERSSLGDFLFDICTRLVCEDEGKAHAGRHGRLVEGEEGAETGCL